MDLRPGPDPTSKWLSSPTWQRKSAVGDVRNPRYNIYQFLVKHIKVMAPKFTQESVSAAHNPISAAHNTSHHGEGLLVAVFMFSPPEWTMGFMGWVTIKCATNTVMLLGWRNFACCGHPIPPSTLFLCTASCNNVQPVAAPNGEAYEPKGRNNLHSRISTLLSRSVTE